MIGVYIAECILGLFSTRQRAASMAGDLAESNPRVFRFWCDVLRTAFGFLRRDMAFESGKIAGLAIRAWLLQMVFFVLCWTVLGIVITLVIQGFGLRTAPDSGYLSAIGLTVGGACDFLVGRWLARRAHGREIAAVFAVHMVQFLASTLFVTAIVLRGLWGATWLDAFSLPSPLFLLLSVPMFAGAIIERRNRMKETQ
jgi:hypothetical protein